MATNNQFTIQLPSGWSDQTIHSIVGPVSKDVQHLLSISIDTAPETVDLEKYADTRIVAIKNDNPALEILKEARIELPSGRVAFEFTTKNVTSGNPPQIHRRLFVIEEKRAFVFTATLAKQTLHTLGVEITQMIDSLLIYS